MGAGPVDGPVPSTSGTELVLVSPLAPFHVPEPMVPMLVKEDPEPAIVFPVVKPAAPVPMHELVTLCGADPVTSTLAILAVVKRARGVLDEKQEAPPGGRGLRASGTWVFPPATSLSSGESRASIETGHSSGRSRTFSKSNVRPGGRTSRGFRTFRSFRTFVFLFLCEKERIGKRTVAWPFRTCPFRGRPPRGRALPGRDKVDRWQKEGFPWSREAF